jgi:hypothetical protein
MMTTMTMIEGRNKWNHENTKERKHEMDGVLFVLSLFRVFVIALFLNYFPSSISLINLSTASSIFSPRTFL